MIAPMDIYSIQMGPFTTQILKTGLTFGPLFLTKNAATKYGRRFSVDSLLHVYSSTGKTITYVAINPATQSTFLKLLRETSGRAQ